jgi:NAD(P)-dependent dehydrogenase (short-subunit alcohol dehydrogenase family)
MSNRIALILGAGAGVGTHVASRLRSEGYRVATVSRSAKDAGNNNETAIALGADLANPTEVEKVFERVREAWGEPNVVVYNGMELEITAEPNATSNNGHANIERQHTQSPVARPQKPLWTSPQKNSSGTLPSTRHPLSSRHEKH